jgi:type IV secretory pathway VirB2 component (pilin)
MKLKKQDFFAFLFCALLAAPLAAQGIVPPGMTTLMGNVRDIFTGPFVKTILVICLMATAVVFGFNKDNEKMKRNCIAIGVAIAVIGTATFIVDAIWGASQTN